MRKLLVFSFVVAFASHCLAAPPASTTAQIRTVKNIPNFPLQALKVGVSRKLYQSLLVSPVSAYLVARTALIGSRSANAKIVHTEGNGAYDEMILDAANSYGVTGQNTIESRVQSDTLNAYLVIYEIKDGKMAVCFANSDDARYAGYRQSGLAWVGLSQAGGKWTTISGKPQTKWRGARQ